MCDAHKKRIAVDIARAINQREEKHNHMKRRANLRIAMRREVPNPNLPLGVRIGTLIEECNLIGFLGRICCRWFAVRTALWSA